MKKFIITERLYLRELNVADYKKFYNLNLDNNVLKYTGDKPFKNLQGAKKFLKNYFLIVVFVCLVKNTLFLSRSFERFSIICFFV